MKSKITQTTCPYCGVGCGVGVSEKGIVGDVRHSANLGKTCIKGASLEESLSIPNRILYPKMGSQLVDWDTVTDTIASKIQQVVMESGAEAIAMYVSGQCLTEDYYVANKWMKGFVGSANIDTNSRLCMSSAVAGYVRAFGEDVVPVNYQDIEHADLVILIGSNMLWTHPVLYQRILTMKQANTDAKVVVIDPRKTETAKQADLFLALESDTDLALLNGLMRFLIENNGVDHDFVSERVEGEAALYKMLASEDYELERVAQMTGLSEAEVQRFFEWFVQASNVVTCFCQGVNQSQLATDTVNGIINVHLLSGKFARKGCGPFSLTGQPNAMGGREVGGLANQLAVHRGFDAESIQQIGDFWQAPNMVQSAGKKAVDLFDAVLNGEIRVLWIMATNPVISLPNLSKIQTALSQCEFVIVSDMTWDADTVKYADVVLPAAAWGEKSGMVTNSERCLSRQRAFLPMLGESKPDWWAICEVAKKMGYGEAFDFHSSADIFREHAALSGINRDTPYLFDISPLAALSDNEYEAWQPTQWPLRQHILAELSSRNRASLKVIQETLTPHSPYEYVPFATASGKARLCVTPYHSLHLYRSPTPLKASEPQRFWILNTGRQRDQWHTMTRTGHIEHLSDFEAEPTIYVHSQCVTEQGWKVGEIMALSTPENTPLRSQYARLAVDDGLLTHQAFMSMHWAGAFGQDSAVNHLVPAHCDPISGQPAFKSGSVSIKSAQMGYYGAFIGDFQMPEEIAYRSFQSIKPQGAWRFADTAEWYQAGVCRLFLSSLSRRQTILMESEFGVILLRFHWDGKQNVLDGICALSPSPLPIDIADFSVDLKEPVVCDNLLNRFHSVNSPRKKTICACFQVTDLDIQAAVMEQGILDLDTLVQTLKCSTNCGGCWETVQTVFENSKVERDL